MLLIASSSIREKTSWYGSVGVIFYFILSMPVIRSMLFGEKGKVLDDFSGNVSFAGDIINIVGQVVLLIPFYLNEYFFSRFDFNEFNIAVFILFCPVVYRYFALSKSISSFLILLFLFFPAPLLFLSTFNKETLLVLSLFLAYGYTSSLLPLSRGRIFFLYALVLRPYLLFLPFIINSKNFIRMALGSFVVLLISLLFEITREIIFSLFNRRLAEKSLEANSEIIQSTYVSSLYDVFSVLGEVLPQILFPFFLEANLKNFIFQSYVSVFIFLCIKFRNNYSNALLALFSLYVILDPDLGAFFRHLSSFFILFPMMLCLDKKASKIYKM